MGRHAAYQGRELPATDLSNPARVGQPSYGEQRAFRSISDAHGRRFGRVGETEEARGRPEVDPQTSGRLAARTPRARGVPADEPRGEVRHRGDQRDRRAGLGRGDPRRQTSPARSPPDGRSAVAPGPRRDGGPAPGQRDPAREDLRLVSAQSLGSELGRVDAASVGRDLLRVPSPRRPTEPEALRPADPPDQSVRRGEWRRRLPSCRGRGDISRLRDDGEDGHVHPRFEAAAAHATGGAGVPRRPGVDRAPRRRIPPAGTAQRPRPTERIVRGQHDPRRPLHSRCRQRPDGPGSPLPSGDERLDDPRGPSQEPRRRRDVRPRAGGWRSREGDEKRKARLEAPPRENPRDRESYLGLRELLLTDASGRKAFMAVHWKGKPSGLTLLCQLLSDGNLVPEADTDGDYLEAELDHPDKGHPDHRAKDGQWNIGHGWTVVRERADGGVRTYRAESKSAD